MSSEQCESDLTLRLVTEVLPTCLEQESLPQPRKQAESQDSPGEGLGCWAETCCWLCHPLWRGYFLT